MMVKTKNKRNPDSGSASNSLNSEQGRNSETHIPMKEEETKTSSDKETKVS